MTAVQYVCIRESAGSTDATILRLRGPRQRVFLDLHIPRPDSVRVTDIETPQRGVLDVEMPGHSRTVRAMWRRPVYLLMVVSAFSTICRRSMASHAAAAGTRRYAVRLLSPQQGPVLGVGHRDDKASAVSSYEVLQEPAGAPFDGLQVRAYVTAL